MRDVHQFARPYQRQRYQNGAASTKFTGSGLGYRSTRSDIQPTTPVSPGVFATPTNYRALFTSSSQEAGSCSWRTHNWPYSGSWTRWEDIWDGTAESGMTMYGIVPTDIYPVIPESVVSRARQKAITKLKGTSLNLGTFLGELRESASLIIGLLAGIPRAVARAIKGLKSGNRRSARPAKPADLAGSYLMYQFGLLPLASDIYAIAQEIEQGLVDAVDFVKAEQEDESFALPKDTATVRYRGNVKRGVEVGYTIKVDDPGLFQLWKFGLINPASIAWELFPLSFVVDWFTGIGNFLSALDSSTAIRVLHGYETRFLRNDFTREEKYFPDPVPNRTVVDKDAWAKTTISTTSMKREVLPFIVPPLPYLQWGLDLNKATSVVALLAQHFR